MDMLARPTGGVRIARAAEIMEVSKEQVRKLIKDGTLQTYGTGNGVRVRVDSLKPWLPPDPGSEQEPKPAGFIYLVRLGLYHKIGFAKNVQARMSALNSGHPEEISLVHSFPTNDMRRAESLLHKRFAVQRIRGEWFDLSSDDIQEVVVYKDLMF